MAGAYHPPASPNRSRAPCIVRGDGVVTLSGRVATPEPAAVKSRPPVLRRAHPNSRPPPIFISPARGRAVRTAITFVDRRPARAPCGPGPNRGPADWLRCAPPNCRIHLMPAARPRPPSRSPCRAPKALTLNATTRAQATTAGMGSARTTHPGPATHGGDGSVPRPPATSEPSSESRPTSSLTLGRTGWHEGGRCGSATVPLANCVAWTRTEGHSG